VNRLGDRRHRCASEGLILGRQREHVAGLRIELEDGFARQATGKRVKSRWARTRGVLPGDPGEDLVLGGADVAPQTGEIGSVTENDAACHPSPSLPARRSDSDPALEFKPRNRGGAFCLGAGIEVPRSDPGRAAAV